MSRAAGNHPLKGFEAKREKACGESPRNLLFPDGVSIPHWVGRIQLHTPALSLHSRRHSATIDASLPNYEPPGDLPICRRAKLNPLIVLSSVNRRICNEP